MGGRPVSSRGLRTPQLGKEFPAGMVRNSPPCSLLPCSVSAPQQGTESRLQAPNSCSELLSVPNPGPGEEQDGLGQGREEQPGHAQAF